MTYIALGISLLFIIIDRLTKHIAVVNIKPVYSVPVIKFGDTEVLNLTYCENRGAAFSILQNKLPFLITVTSIFIAVLVILLLSKKITDKFLIWSFSLIIAGGAGNLIDRVQNGFVVDFIDFRIIHFAVFNVADICAVAGTVMLLLYVIFGEIKSKKGESVD